MNWIPVFECFVFVNVVSLLAFISFGTLMLLSVALKKVARFLDINMDLK